MRNVVLALAVMVALTGLADGDGRRYWREGPLERGVTYTITADQIAQLQSIVKRPVCERIEVADDGMIIETWHGDGRFWAVTNQPVPVVGAKLKSTFEERMAEVREERDLWRASFTDAEARAELQSRRADRAEARFANATNRLQSAIDSAALPTTQLLLQGILDAILATGTH